MDSHNNTDTTKSHVHETVTINIEPFLTPLSIVVAGFMVTVAVLIGANNIANKSGVLGTTITNNGTTVDSTVTVSVDNDAMRGDKANSKVALIEFSDYNCSFCSKFHQTTISELVKQYVDTGKIVHVYRDYPGVGGETTYLAANAAECVREQVGDGGFFNLIDSIYKQSGTRDVNTVKTLAQNLGQIDNSRLDKCIQDQKYRSEVETDLAAGRTAGIDGTPGFIVGKVDANGNVTGTKISGAQSFDTFKTEIEKYLAQ